MPDALIRVVVQGDEAVAGVGRLEQAFGRMERSAPTMALRTARRAIDELAVAATGLHPVMGRVLATFAEMGIGGAVGLGAVAGFAAIGFEIKTIIEFADKLDKKLIQLNTTIARGPAALAFKAQAFGQQADDLQNPGVWQTVKNTFMDMITDKGAAVGRAAQLATAQTGEALAQRDYEKARLAEQRTAAREASKAIADSALALDKLKLGLHPTNLQLAALDSAARLTAIALSSANEETKKRLQLLELERGHLEMSNAAMKDRMEHPERIAMWHLTMGGRTTGRGNTFTGGTPLPGQDPMHPAESAMASSTFGFSSAGLHGAPAGDKINTARLAAEAVALLGALQGGGAGGVLSAGGSLLSSIKGVPGPVGPIVTALGGVVSLFDHSAERRQREMMDELRRIRQNTDKRGQPERTSVTIMLNGKELSGALVEDVIYQVNRLSRRDATPRLPRS